jgi:hypothetical protein
MEPDLAPYVADRDDTTLGAAGQVLSGFDLQKQTRPCGRDSTDVDSFHTEQRIRAMHLRPQEQDIELFIFRASFGYWFAWSLPIQRGPDLFPSAPHRKASAGIPP